MPIAARLLRLALVIAVSFALGYGLCFMRHDLSRDTAARVNGEVIPVSELYSELLKRFGPDVLRDLVHQRLIIQEARKRGIQTDTIAVEKRLAEMKAQAEVQTMLKSGQVDEADLRRNLMTVGPLDTMVKSQLTVDEENVFFKQHRRELESITVQQILLLDKAVATRVYAEASKPGVDFSALAKKYSLDTRSKPQGGLLGEMHRGELEAELADTLFALQPGQVSKPIESEDGIHIFRIVSSKTSLDELRSEIEQRLIAVRRGDFVDELRAGAKIETVLPYRLPSSITNDASNDSEH